MNEPDPETIEAQLATQRRTLTHLLEQATHHSAGQIVADIAQDIDAARADVERLKAMLRERGVVVVDEPNDAVVRAAGGDVVMGEQHNVTTEGGDYAERDIDKRQGAFITDSTIYGNVIGQQTVNYYRAATPRLDRQQQRNRQAMLTKVRTIWIEGLLHQSLAQELRIALDLTEQPDAVLLPLNALVQELRRPPRPLLPGTPIIRVFEQMGGTLLILGAPGSGKTTLLLELARDLIARAEHDHAHPIPVVFNLSSWALKRRPLVEWLLEELNIRYDVPRRVAQAWIAADEVLPLLDGLDEVAAERRGECVATINTYREEHGLVPLTVCSRVADYEALSAKLRLQGAVIVQTLTPQQVEAYLEWAGEQLTGVRAALRDDAELRAMLDTPLMLSIVTLAYKDTPVEALQLGGTQDEHRQGLFAAYIRAMFGRRSAKARYSQHQTLHWLSSLAYEMNRQAQTVFLVEHLQPQWLPTRAAKVHYVLLDRYISGLVFGLVFGLVGGLHGGLVFGLVGGLLGGAVLPFFGGQARIETLQQRAVGRIIFDALVGALVFGLVFGLVGGLLGGLVSALDFGLVSGLVFGQLVGQLVGLHGGLLGGLLGVWTGKPGMSPRQVIIIERLRWVWGRAWRSAVSGLAVGLVVGLIVGQLGELFDVLIDVALDVVGGGLMVGVYGGLLAKLVFVLVIGLVVGLVVGLVGGLVGGPVTATVRVNQGIRRSARSALVGGLVGGLVVGLVYRLLDGLLDALLGGLLDGLVVGLVFGLAGGLAFGGYTCLSHLALRIILHYQGSLPLRLVPFLDSCADRILLRKVGGGYIFVHRLLLEHFASLHESATEGEAMNGQDLSRP